MDVCGVKTRLGYGCLFAVSKHAYSTDKSVQCQNTHVIRMYACGIKIGLQYGYMLTVSKYACDTDVSLRGQNTPAILMDICGGKTRLRYWLMFAVSKLTIPIFASSFCYSISLTRYWWAWKREKQI